MNVITIGGKNRPVRFGINALAEFNKATGTNFEWIFKIAQNPLSVDFDQLRWLVFVGLKNGAAENNQAIDFTITDVGHWLDKDFKTFPEFVKILGESLPELEDDEKNPTGPSRAGQ